MAVEMVQISPPGSQNPNYIVIYFNGEFTYIEPMQGWVAYIKDEQAFVVYENYAWRRISSPNAYRVHPTVTQSMTIPEAAFADGRTIIANSAEPITLTISETPSDAVVANGSDLARRPTTIVQRGPGQVIIEAGAGIELLSADAAKKTRAQYSCLSIIPISQTTFVLAGDLVP